MAVIFGRQGERIIPAQVKNEKEEALCPESPTNVHYLTLGFDAEGRTVPVKAFACEVCGQPIKASGSRWVLDRYIIQETDDIRDLL